MFNYWRRSPANWFFNFIFPLLFLAFFRNFIPLASLLPMFLVSTSFRNGVSSLAIAYTELKQSAILKKIPLLPLTRSKVVTGLIFFNSSLILSVDLWIFSWAGLLFGSEINFGQVKWFYFFLALFLGTLLASLVGFLIGSWVSNPQSASNYLIITNLLATFFSGQNIPIEWIKKSSAMTRIAKLTPFSYPVNLAIRAFSHGNLIDQSIQANLLFDNYWQPLIFCLAWIAILLLLAFWIHRFPND